MNYTAGLLLDLVAFTLLLSVHSFPTDNGTPSDPFQSTEYSLEDLKNYFDEKESGSSFEHKNQFDTTLYTSKIDAVSSPVDQSLAASQINLSQEVFVDYNVYCSPTEQFHEIFNFMILYNGKEVTFRKVPSSNIDTWGTVKVGTIHPGQPIYTEVPFSHTFCKPVTRTEVCTFHFSGIAQANIIYYGKNPSIFPSAAQPSNKDWVYVTQACNEHPGPNGKIPCPAPTGSKCWLKDVGVDRSG